MSSPNKEGLLCAGDEVGPYKIVRHLGSGAFGVVYEAYKSPLDKHIALKLLHRDRALDTDVVSRFMREARAAASLRHPHIVDVDDVGVVDGVPFLAMEFLEGESLAELLAREGKLTVHRALGLLLPIFSAVAAVHARGVVHRDIKPANVFLWRALVGQEHPKLLDFGIAKIHEGQSLASLTLSSAILGTPMYMSVEQWESARLATGQSDQWSLGVMLFLCLTARFPFEADGVHALMMRVLLQPPCTLREAEPGLPEGLERALMRSIEKKPEDRHASVQAFGRALLPFASAADAARWAPEFGESPAGSIHPPASIQGVEALQSTRPAPDSPAILGLSTLSHSGTETPVRASAPWKVGSPARFSALVLLGSSALAAAGLFYLKGQAPRAESTQTATSQHQPPREVTPLTLTPTVALPSPSVALPAEMQVPAGARGVTIVVHEDSGVPIAPATRQGMGRRPRRPTSGMVNNVTDHAPLVPRVPSTPDGPSTPNI